MERYCFLSYVSLFDFIPYVLWYKKIKSESEKEDKKRRKIKKTQKNLS
jgi:hypothetical protein